MTNKRRIPMAIRNEYLYVKIWNWRCYRFHFCWAPFRKKLWTFFLTVPGPSKSTAVAVAMLCITNIMCMGIIWDVDHEFHIHFVPHLHFCRVTVQAVPECCTEKMSITSFAMEFSRSGERPVSFWIATDTHYHFVVDLEENWRGRGEREISREELRMLHSASPASHNIL